MNCSCSSFTLQYNSGCACGASDFSELEKFKVGDYFTISHWKRRCDRSYVGACMRVKLIEYPFIRAHRYSEVGNRVDTITLDIREVSLITLSDEFVSDVLGDRFNDR